MNYRKLCCCVVSFFPYSVFFLSTFRQLKFATTFQLRSQSFQQRSCVLIIVLKAFWVESRLLIRIKELTISKYASYNSHIYAEGIKGHEHDWKNSHMMNLSLETKQNTTWNKLYCGQINSKSLWAYSRDVEPHWQWWGCPGRDSSLDS